MFICVQHGLLNFMLSEFIMKVCLIRGRILLYFSENIFRDSGTCQVVLFVLTDLSEICGRIFFRDMACGFES